MRDDVKFALVYGMLTVMAMGLIGLCVRMLMALKTAMEMFLK